MHKGIAILTTSMGSSTIYSPLSENMTNMVKSKAINVIGLILGMNSFSYHSRLGIKANKPGKNSCNERDAEINEYTFGNLFHGNLHD